jgi:hypothetical protein
MRRSPIIASHRFGGSRVTLLGRWYLQVITQLFKESRLAKGQEFDPQSDF